MNELVAVDGHSAADDCDALRVASHSAARPATADRGVSVALAVLDNRWLVIGLVLVAGPVGLPALWFSRRFSRGVKIAATVFYALMTAVLPLAVVWYWCELAVRPLVDALAR